MDELSQKKLITTKDAGEFSGYTSDYLGRLVRQGKITGKRIGHSWFIDEPSLRQFLETQKDRKVAYVRSLTRVREAEYKAHRSLVHRVKKTLSTPLVFPEIGGEKNALRSQAFALSFALFVVVSLVSVSRSPVTAAVLSRVALLAQQTSYGFTETFGDIPVRIQERIALSTTQAQQVHDNIRNENIFSPSQVAFDFSLSRELNTSSRGQSFALEIKPTPTVHDVPPASHPHLTIAISPAEIFATLSNPSAVSAAIQNTYQQVGLHTYGAIVALMNTYQQGIETAGSYALVPAALVRDVVHTLPRTIVQSEIAFGTEVIALSHRAIGADVAVAYTVVDVAPKSAAKIVALIGNVGDTLAQFTSRVPHNVATAYLQVTALPATLGPAVAARIFNTEYRVAVETMHGVAPISEQYLAGISATGEALFTLGSAAHTAYAGTVRSLALLPSRAHDAYLGALGKTALVFDSLMQVPSVAAVAVATAPALSVGEQVALTTYETIHGLFDGASRSLAALFGPPPTLVLPTVKPHLFTVATTTVTKTTSVAVNSYPRYTTVVQGVSSDFVNNAIASLRGDILSTVSGMIQPVAAQTAQNITTIQQVNMIQDLSNLIVRNGDFRGGNLTGGGSVSAHTGTFDNLTVNGVAITGSGGGGTNTAAYFTATSTDIASNLPYASTTALTVSGVGGLSLGTLNGPLQANAGAVSATSSVGVLYGGTGLSVAPTYGQVLLGNASGGYTLTATSSLGINSGVWGAITGTLSNQTDLQSALDAKLSLASWFATTTAPQLLTLPNLTGATTTNLNITNAITGAGLAACAGSSSKLLWDAVTGKFSCGIDAGSTSGLASLNAQYSSPQTGSSQTFATTSDTNLGLTITSASDVHTFTPFWIGTLAVTRGGTGLSSFTPNSLLYSNAAGTGLAFVATSTLNIGGTAANVTGTVAVTNGGTGTTTAPVSQLLYGGTGGIYQSVATSSVTAGTGVTFSGTPGAFVGGTSLTINTPWTIAGNNIFNNNSGFVGLGTSTPSYLLNLATSTAPQLALSDGSLTSSHWTFRNAGGNLYIGTSSPSTFATSSPSNLTLLNNGAVGIGIAAPVSPLHILTNNTANNTIVTLQNSGSWVNQQITSIDFKDATAVTGALGAKYNSTSNTVDFLFHSLYNGGYKNSSNVSLIVKGDGRVGIGTTSPAYLLNLATSTAPQLALSDGSLTSSHWTFQNAGGNLYIGTSSPSTFGTTSPALLTLLNNGNIGIGTTSPYASLSINGLPNGSGPSSGQASPYFAIATSSTARPFFAIASTTGFNIDGGITQPSHRASISNGGSALLAGPYDVAVANGYAYVVSNTSNALEIINVATTTPFHVASLSNGAGGAVISGPRAIKVVGKYAYILSNTGNALEIVDVSDPSHPVHKGSLSDGVGGAALNTPEYLAVSGNYAYIVSTGSNALEIVDISNPANPVHKGQISNGTGGASLSAPVGLYVANGYAYVAANGALEIVDISNPANPVHKGKIVSATGVLLANASSVYVQDNVAYVTSWTNGTLEIVNVANPTSPTHLVSLTNGGGGGISLSNAYQITVNGKYAYITTAGSSANSSFEVVDVSNPTNPLLVSKIKFNEGGALLNVPGHFVISGNYAYITVFSSNALEILDIGGATISNAQIGSARVDTLQVSGFAQFNQHLVVHGDLNVGNNAMVSGALTVSGNFASTSVSGLSTLNVGMLDTNTSGISDIAVLTHTATSTSVLGANGIGAGLLFKNADATGVATSTARIASLFTSVGGTATSSVLTFSTKNSLADLQEWMRLDQNGNLGIGTTSPAYKLNVANANAPQLSLSDSSLTSNHWTFRNAGGNLYLATSSPSTFATSTVNALTIDTNGDITTSHALTVGTSLTLGTALTVANGGTGTTTAPISQLIYGGGAGVYQSVATTSLAIGSEFSHSGTLGALVGGSAGTLTLSTNGTALTKLAQIAANTILGNNTGSTGNVIAFATSSLGIALSDTTGVLAIAKGGTASSTPLGGILAGNGASAIKSVVIGSGLTFDGTTLTSTGGGGGSGAGFASTTLSNESVQFYGKGYIGIGTTTPAYLLHVATGTAPQLALSDGSLTSNHWTFRNAGGNLYLATSSPTTFATSTATALTIDTNGNFGFGTTTPTLSQWSFERDTNGTAALTVTNNSTGNAAVGGFIASQDGGPVNAGSLFYANSGYTTNGVLTPSTAVVFANTGATGGVSIAAAANAPIKFATGGVTEKFRLAANGNLGVGTTTPQWSLQIASSTGAQLALSDGSLTSNHWTFRNAGGNLYLATSSPSTFATSSANALRIDTNGDITTSHALTVGTSLTLGTALTVANGGTGQSTFTASQLLYGNGTNALTSVATSSVTAGTGVTFSGTAGALVGGTSLTINTPWTISGNNIFNNNSANVGIGSTTPWALLSVNPNGITGPAFAVGSSTATNFVITNTGTIGIGTSTPTLAQFSVESGTTNTTAGLFTGNVNNFLELNIQNRNGGTTASSDFVATADIGTASTYYADFGINGSGYNQAAQGAENPLDTYLYSSDTGLVIGTASSTNLSADIRFVQGGLASTSVRAILTKNGFGIGTTTPRWALQIATSSAPQLVLSDGISSDNHWAFRNAGGLFYLATSSPSTFATSTSAALAIDANGFPTFASLGGNIGCAQFDTTGKLSNTGTACGTGGGGADTFKFSTTTSTGFPNAIYVNGGLSTLVGIGTTTPAWMLQIASSTGAQLALSDGSLTSNHWTFRNAGGLLYLATSSPTTLATSSMAALTIDTNGKVGIGTSTPLARLSVVGDARLKQAVDTQTAFVIENSVSSSTLQVSTVDTVNNIFEIATSSGAAYLDITNTGNVGIGTTTPNWLLQVAGTRPTLALSDASAGTNLKHWLFSSMGGNLYIGTSTDALATSSPAALSITNAGSVGIGTTTPWAQLSVNSAGISGPSFVIGSSTATSFVVTNAGNVGVGSSTPWATFAINPVAGTASNQFVVGSSTLTNFIINNTGNVGIGTTTPQYKLQIATSTAAQLALSDSSLTSNHWTFRNAGGFLYIATSSPATFATSTMSALTINTNGFLGIGTTTPYASISSFGLIAGANLNADNAAATSTLAGGLNVGAGNLNYNFSTGETSVGSLLAGTQSFDTDAGAVQWTDIPVSAAATGTPQSYTAFIGGNPAITVFGLASGPSQGAANASTTYNNGVAIGTTTANATFTVWSRSAVAASTTAEFINSASSTLFKLVDSGTGYFSGIHGIGTTTPAFQLQVASSTKPQLALSDASLTSNHWTLRNAGGFLYFATSSPSTYATSTATALTIDTNGFVGVGTTSPWRQFSTTGTVSFSGLTSGTTGNTLCLTTNNEVTSGASCTVSSQRYKHDITPFAANNSGLAEVLALQPVSFKYNQGYGDNGQQTQLGFIAEQAVGVDARLVPLDKDGLPSGFFYQNYTAVLTQAIHDIEGAVNTTAFVGNSSGAAPLTIAASGNVGVGTSVPSAKLTVSGNVLADAYESTPIVATSYTLGTTTVTAAIPDSVLTATGNVDLYKLATYTLSGVNALATRLDAQDVRLTSLEARVAALESGAVSSASPSPLALSTTSLASAFSSFGVLIQKGIAQFNTLVFRQLVASSDSNGTSSAGSVNILAGNTVAQVNNALVHASTKVFVTFNTQVTGSWWVSDKAEGSFRVILSAPQTGDVSFDYFLVQTQGQIATSTPDGSFETSPSVSQSNGVDTTAPTITLLGDNPLHLAVGDTFAEPGITVTDAADGTDPYITFVNGIEQVVSASTIDTSVPTTYIITYKATDHAGNISTAMRSVIVGNPGGGTSEPTPPAPSGPVDTTAPVVTLVANAALQLAVGNTFTDPGATAADDTDGDLTNHIVVTGSVDTGTPGLYTLTYSATDAAGNVGTASRVVTVVAAP